MTMPFKTLLAIAALATSATLFAQPVQPTAVDDSGQGVIGKRYVEGSLGLQNIDDLSDNQYFAGVAGNLPVTSFLDVTGSYSHRWIESHGDLKSDIIGATAIWYSVIEDDVKPFIAGGLGFRWDGFPTRTEVSKSSTSYGLWNVGIGAEFPYKWVSVTPTISYNDDLRNSTDSQQSIEYGATIDSRVTDRISVYVKGSYTDVRHSGQNGWFMGTGVRVRL